MKINLEKWTEEEKRALQEWVIDLFIGTSGAELLLLANALSSLKLWGLAIITLILEMVVIVLRASVFNSNAKLKDFESKIESNVVRIMLKSCKFILILFFLVCLFFINRPLFT